MPLVNFLFDAVVTRIEVDDLIIDDPKKLLVSGTFNKKPLDITSSRINVTELEGRPIQCTSDYNKLRGNLLAGGLPMFVRYGGRMIGNATMEFSKSFLDQIINGMSDVTEAFPCDIINNEEKVGSMELLCCLTTKCEEQALPLEQRKEPWLNTAKAISMRDILFVIGPTDPCPLIDAPCLEELEPQEGDELLNLDLSRYRSLGQRRAMLSENTSDSRTTACSVLRKHVAQFENTIDSVMQRITHLCFPLRTEKQYIVSGEAKPKSCAGWSRTIPVPIADSATEIGIKPPRFCPFCLASMSWLPKYASCTRCQAKARPVLEEDFEETSDSSA